MSRKPSRDVVDTAMRLTCLTDKMQLRDRATVVYDELIAQEEGQQR